MSWPGWTRRGGPRSRRRTARWPGCPPECRGASGTMESRESIPFSALLSTGTPSTGRRVWAAIMPGRWAAPAGTRDDDFETPSFGLGRVFGQPVGRAVGRDDPAFVGHAELLKHIPDIPHGVPVRLAAHNHADEGIGRRSVSHSWIHLVRTVLIFPLLRYPVLRQNMLHHLRSMQAAIFDEDVRYSTLPAVMTPIM